MSAVAGVVGWAVLDRLEELDAKLKKVNKQAAKLGVPGMRYEQTGKQELRVVKETVNGLDRKTIEKALFIEIELIGEIPKLPGDWELLAVIDHSEGAPIVKCVPGRELPKGQRDRGPVCDHCGKKRGRVDTFVLRDVDGKVVQVGRQCLADFLGLSVYNPDTLLAMVAFLQSALSGLDQYDFGYSDGSPLYGRRMIDVLEVVIASGACIDEDGWVSRREAAEKGGGATADTVSFVLYPPKQPTRQEFELLQRYRSRMTEELEKEAAAAIEWAKAGLGGDNDYLNNLGVCATRGAVGQDKFGIVVSLIATYRREMETLRMSERKGARSVFVGEVKKRMGLKLTLVGKPRAFDSDWGSSYRCEFSDADGNVYVWWTGNDPCFDGGWEVGTEKEVKATVKKHEEFKGVKTTVLTRVSY